MLLLPQGLVSSLKEKNEKYEKQVKEMDSERSQSERGLRDVKEAMKDKDIEVEELNLRVCTNMVLLLEKYFR